MLSRHLSVFIALAFARVCLGQCELMKILPSDGEPFDEFGNAVDIDGNVVIVGAHLEDEDGNDAGAAYIFQLIGQSVIEHKLLGSGVNSNDHFGHAVAVSGDAAIIGAPLFLTGIGGAYFFRFDGESWIEQAGFSSVENASRFGHAVGICGDVAIVGAPSSGSGTSAVEVFRFFGNQWISEFSIDTSGGAMYGKEVAICGDLLVFRRINPSIVRSYFYDGDEWAIVPDVSPADESDHTFGHALCLDGIRLAAGRPGDNVNGSNSGSVYLFSFDGVEWIQEAKLLASDGQPDDDFGIDVSLDGDSLLVGSSGASYFFRFESDTWVERAKMQSSDGVPADEFGVSSSLSGDVAIIGAKLNNDNGEFSGSAYLFSVDIAEDDCNGNGTPDVCELDEADCDGNRVPDICETLYFVSASEPLGPFGDGMPASYMVGSLPPVSPQPKTQVMVTVTADADLNSLVEWIDVFVGGQMIGRLFEKDGEDCPLTPIVGQLAMPGVTARAV